MLNLKDGGGGKKSINLFTGMTRIVLPYLWGAKVSGAQFSDVVITSPLLQEVCCYSSPCILDFSEHILGISTPISMIHHFNLDERKIHFNNLNLTFSLDLTRNVKDKALFVDYESILDRPEQCISILPHRLTTKKMAHSLRSTQLPLPYLSTSADTGFWSLVTCSNF